MDISQYRSQPLGWETDAEWKIEIGVFHACGREDVPEDVRDLIRVLWWQYCLHAAPKEEE